MAQMNSIERAHYERERLEQMEREYKQMKYEYEQRMRMSPPGMYSSRSEPTSVYGLPMGFIAELAQQMKRYGIDCYQVQEILERYGKIKEGK